jgi:beta-aspartyl-peptidase (threonine type)
MNGKIIVHGGAGFWRRDVREAVNGVGKAAASGSNILAGGGSAVDAVEEAVSIMEDDPVFNAGRGSSLTFTETVEMDAAIMDGSNLSAGAVALVHRVKNPVQLARLVMEKTDHVLLAGRSAEALAEAYSLPTRNPITAEKRRRLLLLKKNPKNVRLSFVKRNPALIHEHPELISSDTVGAVAVDLQGRFAAAASTGGTMMKLPGRIGDTPQIGSGLYSDNRSGAATVTGWGEIAIRLTLSKAVCCMMERGASAPRAAEAAVKAASTRLKGQAGVIAIDRKGRIAAVHNSPFMLQLKCEAPLRNRVETLWHAYASQHGDSSKPFAGITSSKNDSKSAKRFKGASRGGYAGFLLRGFFS